jgi:F-type H+-transporting ATPase subunit c
MEGVFFAKAMAYLGAAIAMGVGTLGPALGQGMIGTKGVENIGKYPESANKIRMTMMIAMALVETSGVFAFAIAMFLILFNR